MLNQHAIVLAPQPSATPCASVAYRHRTALDHHAAACFALQLDHRTLPKRLGILKAMGRFSTSQPMPTGFILDLATAVLSFTQENGDIFRSYCDYSAVSATRCRAVPQPSEIRCASINTSH